MPRRARASRRRPGRPRRRVPAEHPGDARRVPRDREPRRDLGDLRARVRRAQRRRPARPARARSCCSRSTGYRFGDKEVDRREQVAEVRARLPSLRRGRPRPVPRRPDDTLPDAVAWDELLRESAPLAFEQVPFDHPLYVLFSSGTTGLPKAIVHGHGGILIEHHKNHGLSWDIRPGRPPAVVLDDRLDDVERARLDADPARLDRDDRRQPDVPRPGAAVADGRGDASDDARARAGVHARVPQAGHGAGAAVRPVVAAVARDRRLAAAGRGIRVALRAGRAFCPSQQRQRRHRHLHRHRPGLSARAGVRRRARDALPRRRLGRVRPRRQRGRRRARRARDPAADAVDGGRLLERPGRRALPRRVLRPLSGHLASRRLDRLHRARQRDDHRPLGRDAEPRRRPARHGRVLRRARGARRGARQPRRPPRGRRTSSSCSCSFARVSSSTTSCARGSARRCAARSRRGTRPTRSSRCPRSRAR